MEKTLQIKWLSFDNWVESMEQNVPTSELAMGFFWISWNGSVDSESIETSHFFPTNCNTLCFLHWLCSDYEILIMCSRPFICSLIALLVKEAFWMSPKNIVFLKSSVLSKTSKFNYLLCGYSYWTMYYIF